METTRAEERAALARRLHDELGQLLVAFKLRLATLPPLGRDPSGTHEELLRVARDTADRGLSAIRELCRELRRAERAPVDLARMLRQTFAEVVRTWPLDGTFEAIGRPRLVDPAEAHVASMILREAMTNVVRHARATRVQVSLRWRARDVILRVCDDGIGCPAEALARDDAFGLIGMQERAALLEGSLLFRSLPERGTTVIARLRVGRVAASAEVLA